MYPKEPNSSFLSTLHMKCTIWEKCVLYCLNSHVHLKALKWAFYNPYYNYSYDNGLGFTMTKLSSRCRLTTPQENILYLLISFIFLNIFWEETVKVYLVINKNKIQVKTVHLLTQILFPSWIVSWLVPYFFC